jgi:hypothetical protein
MAGFVFSAEAREMLLSVVVARMRIGSRLAAPQTQT